MPFSWAEVAGLVAHVPERADATGPVGEARRLELAGVVVAADHAHRERGVEPGQLGLELRLATELGIDGLAQPCHGIERAEPKADVV